MSLQAMHEQQKRQESSSIELLQAENSRLSSQVLLLQNELQKKSQKIVLLNEEIEKLSKIGSDEQSNTQESSWKIIEEQTQMITELEEQISTLSTLATEREEKDRENQKLRKILQNTEDMISNYNFYIENVKTNIWNFKNMLGKLTIRRTIFGGIKGLKFTQWINIEEYVKEIDAAMSDCIQERKNILDECKKRRKGIRKSIAEAKKKTAERK